ncbi:hypothetical protein ACIRL3_12275 [Streptomyces sp. NPDC102384]|uniref:hypothetical protein n=1 Tax=Streptomyces sp. NPDC102384 TaxID=3366166 RepID=UPI0037FAFD8C
MSRSHGVAGEFGGEAWTAPARTPLYYPDAVTLVPSADPAAVTARIDTAAPGASVKDSFADLDLTDAGFQVLFEARWIHRPAGTPALAPTLAWGVVDDAEALRSWAEAWGDTRLFRPELLDDTATFVLAGRTPDGRVVAGAVASLSGDDGHQVVGISNVFASDAGPDSAWPGVLDAVHRRFPDLPVVGYEQGDDLAVALRHGFETIGPLRVWVHGRP